MNPPVVLAYLSDTCPHCVKVEKIWDDIERELRSVQKDVRIIKMDGRKDLIAGKYPKCHELFGEGAFLPKFILFPGKSWDESMRGRKDHVDITHGCVVMNSNKEKSDKGVYMPVVKYPPGVAKNYSKWLEEAIQDQEFRHVHYKGLYQSKYQSNKQEYNQPSKASVEPKHTIGYQLVSRPRN